MMARSDAMRPDGCGSTACLPSHRVFLNSGVLGVLAVKQASHPGTRLPPRTCWRILQMSW